MIATGVCRHCRCTEDNACRLSEGDCCCWTNRDRTVCSNPSCIKAESARVARIPRARRKSPAEIHELIRNRGRKPRKGRAA